MEGSALFVAATAPLSLSVLLFSSLSLSSSSSFLSEGLTTPYRDYRDRSTFDKKTHTSIVANDTKISTLTLSLLSLSVVPENSTALAARTRSTAALRASRSSVDRHAYLHRRCSSLSRRRRRRQLSLLSPPLLSLLRKDNVYNRSDQLSNLMRECGRHQGAERVGTAGCRRGGRQESAEVFLFLMLVLFFGLEDGGGREEEAPPLPMRLFGRPQASAVVGAASLSSSSSHRVLGGLWGRL